MNFHSVRAIYVSELARCLDDILPCLAWPIISTSLYFIVFGGSSTSTAPIDGIDYGAFIVPGLLILTILTDTISNASLGIFFARDSGSIYEILSAPISSVEVVLGYVGAAATKSVILGALILATARFFVTYHVMHPLWMILFLILTCMTFSVLGFIVGIWADGWQKLGYVPVLIMTPLTFLGGTFYSIDTLPLPWRKLALLDPVVYLISGFRWSFYGVADVNVAFSYGVALVLLLMSFVAVRWIFRTGYKLKS